MKNPLKKFQNTLKNFKNPDNPFFDSIVYGVMCHTTKGKILDKDKMKDVLGNDFYNDLIEKKMTLNLIEQYLDILTDVF